MNEFEWSAVIDFLVKLMSVIFKSSQNNLIITTMSCLTIMIQEGCEMGREQKTLSDSMISGSSKFPCVALSYTYLAELLN